MPCPDFIFIILQKKKVRTGLEILFESGVHVFLWGSKKRKKSAPFLIVLFILRFSGCCCLIHACHANNWKAVHC